MPPMVREETEVLMLVSEDKDELLSPERAVAFLWMLCYCGMFASDTCTRAAHMLLEECLEAKGMTAQCIVAWRQNTGVVNVCDAIKLSCDSTPSTLYKTVLDAVSRL